MAKPIVDRIEREFHGRLLVVRVDIQTATGRSLVRQYGSAVTPTFIYLDGDGHELWRSIGSIDPGRVRDQVQAAE